MQKVLAVVLLSLLIGPVVASAQGRGGPSARSEGSYKNEATPAGWIPQGWELQPTSPDFKGRRYSAPDGSGWLALYATPASKETIAAHKKAVAQAPGEQITYLREKRDWIVVSGFREGRVFYRRAALACGGRSWHHITFEYAADQKRKLDKVVTRLSGALGSLRDQGCQQFE